MMNFALNGCFTISGEVLKCDPFRLEQMDAYSNILYVKEKDAELSFLAHNAIKVRFYIEFPSILSILIKIY